MELLILIKQRVLSLCHNFFSSGYMTLNFLFPKVTDTNYITKKPNNKWRLS